MIIHNFAFTCHAAQQYQRALPTALSDLQASKLEEVTGRATGRKLLKCCFAQKSGAESGLLQQVIRQYMPEFGSTANEQALPLTWLAPVALLLSQQCRVADLNMDRSGLPPGLG